ncbi:hypothetical protein RDI58_012113 [Solanum bulbocastanum]|uniref:Uncharacterized protein n=1 Tax=Solanum bulbocastanum TaxID=147425 RepID=A0AAN8YHY9_SOLBU
MAFRFVGRQMAGRALLGAPTQLRGYCQKISPTKTSSRVGHDVRAFILGGLVASTFYLYWLRNQAFKIKESRKQRRKAALMTERTTWRNK